MGVDQADGDGCDVALPDMFSYVRESCPVHRRGRHAGSRHAFRQGEPVAACNKRGSGFWRE